MLTDARREDQKSRKLMMMKRTKLHVKVKNLTFNQPFSGFIVAVHNSNADPLYEFGEEAAMELASLAEDGNTTSLVELYDGMDGVDKAFAVSAPGPLFPGQTLEFKIRVSGKYPLLTTAAMAINTNDAFIAVNGVEAVPGWSAFLPGLDAGSEENNELCSSIPGPGCPEDSGNERSPPGEGFVHVHRGFFGIGDLLPGDRYDWRNPMAYVSIEE